MVRLGARPLSDSEGRWGEISREMLTTGNWIVPMINGIPYRDKPVGSYWLIALSSLPGHRVTETTARFPSALAIVLAALFLYGITRHFWDSLTAFLSSLLFLTSYPVVFWGRKANGDTLTLLGVLVCVWIFLRAQEKNDDGFGWLYPFFIVAGVTSLMKGLLGFVLPSLVVFSYLLIKNRLKVLDKRFLFHTLSAFTLGLILFLIPIFIDILTTHTDSSLYLVYRENILRFFHPFDHRAPFYYYFGYIFITVAPWSLFIPFLAVTLAKRWRELDAGTLFFGGWFLILFIFFNLSSSKRGYYLMPLIPAYAALLAHVLRRVEDVGSLTRLERFFLIFPIVFIVISGLVAVSFSFFPFIFRVPKEILIQLRVYLDVAGMILCIGGVLAGWLIMKKRGVKGMFVLIGGYFLAFSIGFWFVAPILAKRDSMVPFCRKVNFYTKGSEVGVYGLADRSTLYFYLGRKRPLPHPKSPREAREFFKRYPQGYLVINGRKALCALEPEHVKIVTSGRIKRKMVYYLVRRVSTE